MCGIIYVKNKKGHNVIDEVWKLYTNQKHRGQEGFGFLNITKNKVKCYRAENDVDIKKMLKSIKKADEIMFHHRYPTSTPNLIEATHPIIVDSKLLSYKYYMIHNGIITNDDDLYFGHIKNGFKYNTKITTKQITSNNTYETYCYNDSETLAIELGLFIEGKKKTISNKGSIAFMLLQADKNDKPIALYYGRNYGSPLILSDKNSKVIISSESEDITLDDISDDIIYKKDYSTGKISEIITNVGICEKPKTHYTNDVIGFNSADDSYSDSELMQYEVDDYYELLQQEQDLKKEMEEAKKLKDNEEYINLDSELFYIQQGIKDYERRYNF